MRRNVIISIFCVLLVSHSVYATWDVTNEEMLARCRATGLPILHIETVDSVMPSYEVIYPPEGCVGLGITNNEKVPGHLWIEEGGDTIYDSGVYKEKKSGITIKVRGNTTASADSEKKPYKLKLQKKADLLFRGDDSKYADKDWVLLRMVICETLAGNMVNRALHMPWTPAEKVVALLLNGDFRGMYILTENVKRNQSCRVDVSEEGYIYEYDAYWWNEDYYIPSRFSLNYTLTYPDSEDIETEQEEYLQAKIIETEDAYLTKDGIDDVLDIPSYARWLWVHDMLGDWDSAGSNPFLMKYDSSEDSKTAMTCTWDFGGCFTNKYDKQWCRQHTFWCFYYFFTLPQMAFVTEYINMYDNVVDEAFDIVADKLDSLRMTETAAHMDLAQELENERWNIQQTAPTERMMQLAQFLRTRKQDIADLMTILKSEYNWEQPTTIETVGAEDMPVMLYDVLGRQLSAPANGVVIIRYPDGRSSKVLYR